MAAVKSEPCSLVQRVHLFGTPHHQVEWGIHLDDFGGSLSGTRGRATPRSSGFHHPTLSGCQAGGLCSMLITFLVRLFCPNIENFHYSPPICDTWCHRYKLVSDQSVSHAVLLPQADLGLINDRLQLAEVLHVQHVCTLRMYCTYIRAAIPGTSASSLHLPRYQQRFGTFEPANMQCSNYGSRQAIRNVTLTDDDAFTGKHHSSFGRGQLRSFPTFALSAF